MHLFMYPSMVRNSLRVSFETAYVTVFQTACHSGSKPQRQWVGQVTGVSTADRWSDLVLNIVKPSGCD